MSAQGNHLGAPDGWHVRVEVASAKLERAMLALRECGREEEDDVLDVLDMLDGWCSSRLAMDARAVERFMRIRNAEVAQSAPVSPRSEETA